MRRPLFGAAALLLALGFGNITFGNYKAHEYSKLLEKASESPVTTPRPIDSGPFGLVGEGDTRGRYLTKLRARVDFYDFVVRGGWTIVGVSFLLFVFGFLAWRSEELAASEVDQQR